MGKRWYVLHTYSGYENKVKTNLHNRIESMGLEGEISDVKIPSEELIEIKDGSRKVTEKKVFPGYVLVRMQMTDQTWSVVRNTPGVTGFVGSEGKPVPLSREEYNHIMKRTGIPASSRKVDVDIAVGQAVSVISGPLSNFDGIVSEVLPKSGKVKVMVSIFGRETPVELGFDQIAKI